MSPEPRCQAAVARWTPGQIDYFFQDKNICQTHLVERMSNKALPSLPKSSLPVLLLGVKVVVIVVVRIVLHDDRRLLLVVTLGEQAVSELLQVFLDVSIVFLQLNNALEVVREVFSSCSKVKCFSEGI